MIIVFTAFLHLFSHPQTPLGYIQLFQIQDPFSNFIYGFIDIHLDESI